MKKFKELKAVFEVSESQNRYFKKGDKFVVKRVKSGASAYGDQSAHTIKIVNGQDYYFDTRYEGISTQTTIWRNFWKRYIEKKWAVKVKFAGVSL